MKMNVRITRQNIEFEGSVWHRVVVYDDRKIVAVVEAYDSALAYREARKQADVTGKVPVEILDNFEEDYNSRYH